MNRVVNRKHNELAEAKKSPGSSASFGTCTCSGFHWKGESSASKENSHGAMESIFIADHYAATGL